MIAITIPFDKIDLSKCNKSGLELLMDIALSQEDYLKAAKVRDEFKRRGWKKYPTKIHNKN
jgi:hypothetical protein